MKDSHLNILAVSFAILFAVVVGIAFVEKRCGPREGVTLCEELYDWWGR